MSVAQESSAGQLHRQSILATRMLQADRRPNELAKLSRHWNKFSDENRALLLAELNNAPNCAEVAEALRQLDELMRPQPIPLQRIPFSQERHDRKAHNLSRLSIVKHVSSEVNPLLQQPHHVFQFMNQMDYATLHGIDKARFEQVIWPDTPPASIHEQTELIYVRFDPELIRLLVALAFGAHGRLWGAAHYIDTSGRGVVKIADLLAFNDTFGRPYTKRHFRRLIAEGDGILWNKRGDALWLIGVGNVARTLTRMAADTRPELIATNRPGGSNDVYLPINGTHELFEARALAGWLAARGNPTIALATLASLFGRHQTTISRWLRERLVNWPNQAKGDVQVIRNGLKDSDPDHRLPNTYWSFIRSHNRRGQSRKVAKASNDVVQPLDSMGEGQSRRRRYFDATDKHRELLKRILRRHGTEDKSPRYQLLDRRKYGLSERASWRQIA